MGNLTASATDQLSEKAMTERAPPALFSIGFRPFFLLGAGWSAIALGIWIDAFSTGRSLPTLLPAVTWHAHEMLFGFVLAAIAGFILTAVANWTGRPPIAGGRLAALVFLWAAGRALNLFSMHVPFWIVTGVDVAFPLVLALFVAREVIIARSRRNFMMPLPIAMLALADLLIYLEASGARVSTGIGWRLALAAVITLISVVGARIVPAFTRNWLAARGAMTSLPRTYPWLDRIGSATFHTGLLGWALFPTLWPIGLLLLTGAALTFGRLVGWKGWTTTNEPLLLILHVGYFWMIAGAVLLGIAVVAPTVPVSAAVHALTAGAIGTMVLAVMTRVCRGHTGRPLTADGLAVMIYGAVNLAGVVRVAAELLPAAFLPLLEISAVLWIVAFLLFAFWSAPIVWLPRPDRRVTP
jgi:uncharacterized protein involved in response to NO